MKKVQLVRVRLYKMNNFMTYKSFLLCLNFILDNYSTKYTYGYYTKMQFPEQIIMIDRIFPLLIFFFFRNTHY